MINYEVKNRVAYITFNRPEKRNALSFDMVSHIMANLNQAISDDGVRAIVFTLQNKRDTGIPFQKR